MAASEGAHTIDAIATNDLGETGHADVTVFVDIGPSVSINTPANGTTFTVGEDPSTMTTIIDVSVDDVAEVTEVEFLVDGVSLGVDADGIDGWTWNWNWSTYADGAHTIEAIATNQYGVTGQDDVAVFVDQPDVPMHVASLVGDTNLQRSGKWDAWVTTEIVESGTGNPVAVATVFAQWSNGDTGSCVTDDLGTCDISTVGGKKESELTFTVTDVTHATYSYDAAVVSEVTLTKPN